MRQTAESVIKAAAVAAGLPEASVIDKPKKDSLTLPKPRVELEFMPENLIRSVKKIAKFPKPGAEMTYRTMRTRLYVRELTIRASVVTKEEDELEPLVRALLVSMPHRTSDSDNNLVTVKANQAVRSGFGHRMVKGLPKDRYANTLHIVFSGMICRDTDIPLIRNVNIKDGVTTS